VAEASSKDSVKEIWMTNNTTLEISLEKIGKRFNREWIFRDVNARFVQGEKYAIIGANGSGKSTLLQLIAGLIIPNAGEMHYKYAESQTSIEIQNVYEKIAIAAPYLELIEEMTPVELLTFHSKFKSLTKSISEILEEIQLSSASEKQIRNFSSGMKQRLKLGQAIFSETPILLLDEPTSNLDQQGIDLYHHLIDAYTTNRLVIISSNDANEYRSCSVVYKMDDYK
jgi:ABC-type multidrug transport system ATPase subunit